MEMSPAYLLTVQEMEQTISSYSALPPELPLAVNVNITFPLINLRHFQILFF